MKLSQIIEARHHVDVSGDTFIEFLEAAIGWSFNPIGPFIDDNMLRSLVVDWPGGCAEAKNDYLIALGLQPIIDKPKIYRVVMEYTDSPDKQLRFHHDVTKHDFEIYLSENLSENDESVYVVSVEEIVNG